jgi:hypothetical protein
MPGRGPCQPIPGDTLRSLMTTASPAFWRQGAPSWPGNTKPWYMHLLCVRFSGQDSRVLQASRQLRASTPTGGCQLSIWTTFSFDPCAIDPRVPFLRHQKNCSVKCNIVTAAPTPVPPAAAQMRPLPPCQTTAGLRPSRSISSPLRRRRRRAGAAAASAPAPL